MFIINVVSESRSVNDGERNSNTNFLKLWMEGTLGKNSCRTYTMVQELTDVQF